MTSGYFVEFDIVTYPVIVVFPVILGYEVVVYDIHHDVVGRFTELNNSVAVYFSTALSLGRIVVSSAIEAEFQYFAVTWPGWQCSEFVVSTSRLETFTGSNSTADDANVTLGHRQDICMFELSSSDINISANYSTDSGWDFLRYSNLTATKAYSGDGTFADSLGHFASIWWHSDVSFVSTSFSIRFESAGSTLPIHRWSCDVTSHSPLVLTNEISHPTLTPRQPTDPLESSRALTLGLAVGLPLLAVAIVVLFILLRVLRKRPQWEPLEKSLDLGGPAGVENVIPA